MKASARSASTPSSSDDPEELPNLGGAHDSVNFPAVVSLCDAVIFAFANIAEGAHIAVQGADASSPSLPLPPLWPMVMAAGARQWIATPSHFLKVLQRFGGRLTEIELPAMPPRDLEATVHSCGSRVFEAVRVLRCATFPPASVLPPHLEELWCTGGVKWESLHATPLPRLRSLQPGSIIAPNGDDSRFRHVSLNALTTVDLECWEAEELSAFLRSAPNVTRLGMHVMDLDVLRDVVGSSCVAPHLAHLTVETSWCTPLSAFLPHLPSLESLRATTYTDCVAKVIAKLPSLRHLQLRCKNIGEGQARTKLGDLSFVGQLRSLSLEWDRLAMNPELATLPSTVSSLEHLQLSGPSAVEMAARLVHAGLRTFDITHSNGDDWSDVFRMLTLHEPQLRSLGLKGPIEGKVLVDVLGRCGAALRFLTLDSTSSQESVEARLALWGGVAASCPRLETLQAGSLTPCDSHCLVTLLGHCRSLERVSVSLFTRLKKRTSDLLRQMTARRKLVLQLSRVVRSRGGRQLDTFCDGCDHTGNLSRFEMNEGRSAMHRPLANGTL